MFGIHQVDGVEVEGIVGRQPGSKDGRADEKDGDEGRDNRNGRAAEGVPEVAVEEAAAAVAETRRRACRPLPPAVPQSHLPFPTGGRPPRPFQLAGGERPRSTAGRTTKRSGGGKNGAD